METDEVLQVYVENTDCGRAGKHPELCGFLRIHLKEGQKVRVKVIEADEKGRVRLSMKALLKEEAHKSE